MSWGVPRRPNTSNKLGIPNPREGSDGDIQVRQTGMGARIFAKLGGRWLSNILYGNDLDSQDVFIPKVWQGTVLAPTSAMAHDTAALRLYLPEFINAKNFVHANMRVVYTPNASGQSICQSFYTPSRDPQIEGELTYYALNNYIGVSELNIPGGGHSYAGNQGMLYDADDGDRGKIMITVFFK